MEVRRLRHDPTELLTRAVQPALWLLLFGEVFARARVVPTGDVPYLVGDEVMWVPVGIVLAFKEASKEGYWGRRGVNGLLVWVRRRM